MMGYLDRVLLPQPSALVSPTPAGVGARYGFILPAVLSFIKSNSLTDLKNVGSMALA